MSNPEPKQGKLYQNVTDSNTIDLANNYLLEPYNSKQYYPKIGQIQKFEPWIPKKDVDEAKAEWLKIENANDLDEILRFGYWNNGEGYGYITKEQAKNYWFKKWFGCE